MSEVRLYHVKAFGKTFSQLQDRRQLLVRRALEEGTPHKEYCHLLPLIRQKEDYLNSQCNIWDDPIC